MMGRGYAGKGAQKTTPRRRRIGSFICASVKSEEQLLQLEFKDWVIHALRFFFLLEMSGFDWYMKFHSGACPRCRATRETSIVAFCVADKRGWG